MKYFKNNIQTYTDKVFIQLHENILNHIQETGPVGGILHDLKNSLVIMERIKDAEDSMLLNKIKEESISKCESLLQYYEFKTPKSDWFNILEFFNEIKQEILLLNNNHNQIYFDIIYGDNENIYLDKSMLHSIIINLSKNAIESLINRGTIKVILEINNDQEQLIVSIHDNGCGIPKEKMGSLFTSFSSTKAKGNGLGLPTAKKIVSLLEGDIQVNSIQGKGSTFTVNIPLVLAD